MQHLQHLQHLQLHLQLHLIAGSDQCRSLALTALMLLLCPPIAASGYCTPAVSWPWRRSMTPADRCAPTTLPPGAAAGAEQSPPPCPRPPPAGQIAEVALASLQRLHRGLLHAAAPLRGQSEAKEPPAVSRRRNEAREDLALLQGTLGLRATARVAGLVTQPQPDGELPEAEVRAEPSRTEAAARSNPPHGARFGRAASFCQCVPKGPRSPIDH